MLKFAANFVALSGNILTAFHAFSLNLLDLEEKFRIAFLRYIMKSPWNVKQCFWLNYLIRERHLKNHEAEFIIKVQQYIDHNLSQEKVKVMRIKNLPGFVNNTLDHLVLVCTISKSTHSWVSSLNSFAYDFLVIYSNIVIAIVVIYHFYGLPDIWSIWSRNDWRTCKINRKAGQIVIREY